MPRRPPSNRNDNESFVGQVRRYELKRTIARAAKHTCSPVVCMLIVTFGCSRPSEPVSQNSFRYDQQIGVARIQLENSEGCLAVTDPSIKAGAKVTLVAQPIEKQSGETPGINEATVVEHLSQDCDDHRMYTQELSDAGPAYYRIRTSEKWKGRGYVIAIVDPSGPITLNGGRIEGDLDEDGLKESFRVCLSSEGAHYQVWSGAPLEGRPRWHWYVYAGYDTEPSCTEREYFGPK